MDESAATCFRHDEATRRFFAAHFPREPFLFAHNLQSRELFGLPALARLAEKQALNPYHRGFFAAPQAEGQQWGTESMRQAMSKVFAELATTPARIKLSRIHNDRDYAEVLRQCNNELSRLTRLNLSRSVADLSKLSLSAHPVR
jgi:hypothetical protein